mmetsp:Transcript_41207/g.80551  ORF Transcript_41207/g.80551 Transcript_41207/m.80551 type:complete len:211 (+) Transcript_41207:82-714(+)|eukprot:CAMPEP_0173387580 /NCGR_PEP_ID=MMETSP1356-20130122/10062_1 /TAXON_ID=77927 ORGANISM="Hemiselmis virescens, Strain PCC157" /NCGR_SAMPLE_ID=MMETSP1356 /ASSEMBLY_ACC=CAM_ASM_000847 /LENGTH=210 /DNA_ID=CAMNT_0014344241 /DNA_START=64 /DNA_END=696 /DNA_ORIENTATION=+
MSKSKSVASLPLSCECGQVQGAMKKGSSCYVVCYCGCCQAMLKYLDKEQLMDAEGGVHQHMCAPGAVTFTQGEAHIRSIKLSEKTGTVRWYADCCKTPIGATAEDIPTGYVLFMFKDFISKSADPADVATFMGPIGMRCFAGASKKDTSQLANPKPTKDSSWLMSLFWKIIKCSTGWRFQGTIGPVPFFEKGTKKHISTPVVVDLGTTGH